MQKVLHFIKGLLMFTFVIALSWSVAFAGIAYVKEKRNEPKLVEGLLKDTNLIARVLSDAPDEANRSLLLRDIATTKGYSIYTDAAGGEGLQRYGTIGNGKKDYSPSSADVSVVLEGKIVTNSNRTNPLVAGVASVGISFDVDGKPVVLFLHSHLPALFSGYGSQLLNVYLGFLVMFLLVLVMRPWRKGMKGWVEVFTAIRRVSKGDFKIRLQPNRHMPGQLAELADSINDMAAGLSKMEEIRQTFISNVSHEIQSPLTSIRGFARALQQDGLTLEQRRHYYGIIETESVRLSKLSDNLLKLTSLESDKHPFEPRRYRLDKQLRSMILVCEPQWLEKEITMDLELAETFIEADEDLMSQVWMNLISNSIKFTPQGGRIGVEIEQNSSVTSVTISDNGIGIVPEDLPHIFERFFKADKARDRAAGGSGLGLSIVKRIVEMHGGSASADSPPGSGTAICIRLPRKRDKEKL